MPLPASLPPFSMAYQPIVDVRDLSVYAYEALARGPMGQSPKELFRAVPRPRVYEMDEMCRLRAIRTAARLGIAATSASLAINFIPGGLSSSRDALQATIDAAGAAGIANRRLIFEITEAEQVDAEDLDRIIDEHRKHGFRTAIDDFGSGFSGLSLLAKYQPDIIKIDIELIRDVDLHPAQQVIVHGIVDVCQKLGIEIVAEGVETIGELKTLIAMDVRLFQGFLFARPLFQNFPAVELSLVS